MNENGLRPFVVGCSHCVEVIDTATTVSLCIDKDEDSITRYVPDSVANGLDVRCRQITVETEGIIAGVECGVLEDAFAGRICSRFFGNQSDSPNIEVVAMIRIGWDREKRFHEAFGVCEELILFGGSIAFGKEDEIGMILRIAIVLELGDILCLEIATVDEDALRIYRKFHHGMELHVCTFASEDFHNDGVFRERNRDAVGP